MVISTGVVERGTAEYVFDRVLDRASSWLFHRAWYRRVRLTGRLHGYFNGRREVWYLRECIESAAELFLIAWLLRVCGQEPYRVTSVPNAECKFWSQDGCSAVGDTYRRGCSSSVSSGPVATSVITSSNCVLSTSIEPTLQTKRKRSHLLASGKYFHQQQGNRRTGGRGRQWFSATACCPGGCAASVHSQLLPFLGGAIVLWWACGQDRVASVPDAECADSR